jgi:DNA-binding response OmpR family regulator
MSDVLIVEDEEAVALAVKDLLEGAGYRVVGMAASADDAFALTETQHPDAAIVDVKLAGLIDGISLAQELNARYGLGIVFVTGDPLSVWRHARGLTDEILSKPFSEQELLSAVASACNAGAAASR